MRSPKSDVTRKSLVTGLAVKLGLGLAIETEREGSTGNTKRRRRNIKDVEAAGE